MPHTLLTPSISQHSHVFPTYFSQLNFPLHFRGYLHPFPSPTPSSGFQHTIYTPYTYMYTSQPYPTLTLTRIDKQRACVACFALIRLLPTSPSIITIPSKRQRVHVYTHAGLRRVVLTHSYEGASAAGLAGLLGPAPPTFSPALGVWG